MNIGSLRAPTTPRRPRKHAQTRKRSREQDLRIKGVGEGVKEGVEVRIGARVLTVFPIVLNFGSVSVGKSSTLPVTLANASNQDLTVQQITASPSVYTQTNTCGAS